MPNARKASTAAGTIVCVLLIATIFFVLAKNVQDPNLIVAGNENVSTPSGTASTSDSNEIPSTGNDETAPASTSSENLPVKNPPIFSAGPLISFSFDDGWQSQYASALPILERAGFPATFYVISTRVGTSLHMTQQEILAMEAGGNEIGDHTRTHPELAKLSDVKAEQEIVGARSDLFSLGIKDISTFAYPYGSHGTSTPSLVKAAGLIGARSSRTGLNNDTTNPYLLLSYNLTASTTLEGVESEIDQTIAQKQWLIFEAHHIDESSFDNISSSLLTQIVAYVKQKNLRVATVRDGLQLLNRTR